MRVAIATSFLFLFAYGDVAVMEDQHHHKPHHKKHHHKHHKHHKDATVQSSSADQAGHVNLMRQSNKDDDKGKDDDKDKDKDKEEDKEEDKKGNATEVEEVEKVVKEDVPKNATEEEVLKKIRTLEEELAKRDAFVAGAIIRGRIELNEPLPADIEERFIQGAAYATGADISEIRVIRQEYTTNDIVEMVFEAPAAMVRELEHQAADPKSKLAQGGMRKFLIEDGNPHPGQSLF